MRAQVCWPFNTYIQPGDNYTVDLQAEDVVLNAMTFNVTDDGTLQLSTGGTSSLPILWWPLCALFLPLDLQGESTARVANLHAKYIECCVEVSCTHCM